MRALSIIGLVVFVMSLIFVLAFLKSEPHAATGWGIFGILFGIVYASIGLAMTYRKKDNQATPTDLEHQNRLKENGALSEKEFDIKRAAAVAGRMLFTIIKFLLIAVTIIEILSWTRIDLFQRVADFVDTDSISSIVGFKGGMAPISSWTNARLYFFALAMSMLFIGPIIFISEIQSGAAKTPLEKLKVRLNSGNRINSLGNAANLILLVCLGFSFLHLLPELAHGPLRWIILCSLGVGLGVDNLTYSDAGEKYGMTPVVGKARAIAILAEEEGVPIDELIA